MMKFPKSARIHHRSLQERLFRDGTKLHEYPLRLTWNALSGEELERNFRNKVPEGIGAVQVLVSVPKKKRRKAVDRVLMRRRIREAYRLGYYRLKEKVEGMERIRTLSIGLVYMKEENATFKEIKEKLDRLFVKLAAKIDEKYNADDEEGSDVAAASAD